MEIQTGFQTHTQTQETLQSSNFLGSSRLFSGPPNGSLVRSLAWPVVRTAWFLGLILLAVLLSSSSAQAEDLDSDYGFKVTLPAQWRAVAKKSPSRAVAHRLEGKKPGQYILIKVSSPDPELDPKDALDQLKSSFAQYNPVYVTINKRTWLQMTAKIKAEDGTETQELIFLTSSNQRMYAFNCGGSNADFPALTKAWTAMIQSVTFHKPRLAKTPEPAPKPLPKPKTLPEPSPKPETEPKADSKPEPKPEPTPDPKPEPSLKTPEPKSDKSPEPASGQYVDALNARYGTQIESSSSQFDDELFAARNMIDGQAKSCWRSRPGAKFPHEFVFTLQSQVSVQRVELENKLEKAQLPGLSAQSVVFEASAQSAQGPWQALGQFQAAENGASGVNVKGVSARWIRVRVLKNYGHASLTQIAALRVMTDSSLSALDAGAAKPDKVQEPDPKFKVQKLRLSNSKNGPDSGAKHQAGERVFLCFKPKNMQLSRTGKYWLTVDLKVLGANDKVVVERKDLLNHTAQAPQAPLSSFVSLYIDIPKRFPPGLYKLELTITDKFRNEALVEVLELKVTPFEASDKDESEGGSETKEPDAGEGDDQSLNTPKTPEKPK